METIKKSFLVSLWFMVLTFPIMVIRVNTIESVVEWRWGNLAWVGGSVFAVSLLWRYLLARKEGEGESDQQQDEEGLSDSFLQRFMENKRAYRPAVAVLLALALVFPMFFSSYQTNIMIQALIYVVLGLGLNITVGLVGLLDLGYVAFFAVGAYTYALLNAYFGIGFWTALPLGALFGALCGMLLGFPVLRLRGDYLAIVTLGFASIMRVILQNWTSVTMGPSGVANISRPGLFGLHLSLFQNIDYIYYMMIALMIIVVFITTRLKDSRIGRAWVALREDEIASVAMGIDMATTKLTAYSLGGALAGFVGVIFAAKTTFVNPDSFTFMQSAIVLSIVVLGGMGSILGVILAAFVLILLPEYLRAFTDYRMLVFGASLVLMMIFRPEGLISNVRRKYELHDVPEEAGS
jgi:branched-chain amino acid transport system permease protein